MNLKHSSPSQQPPNTMTDPTPTDTSSDSPNVDDVKSIHVSREQIDAAYSKLIDAEVIELAKSWFVEKAASTAWMPFHQTPPCWQLLFLKNAGLLLEIEDVEQLINSPVDTFGFFTTKSTDDMRSQMVVRRTWISDDLLGMQTLPMLIELDTLIS